MSAQLPTRVKYGLLDHPAHNNNQLTRKATRRSSRSVIAFFAANLIFTIVIIVAGILSNSGGVALFIYLPLLFLLCSSPLLLLERPNGRYAILIIVTSMLFVHYGLYEFFDLLSLLGPVRSSSLRHSWLSQTDVAILIGVFLLIVGYLSSVSLLKRKSVGLFKSEWRISTIITIGLVAWVSGMVATWIWQFTFSDMRAADQMIKYKLTVTSGIVYLVLRMIQPIGTTLLSYAYVVSKKKLLLVLVAMILVVEFLFGFVADSKELSIRGLVLLIATKFLIDGKVPKMLLITATIVIALTFSIFQVYRQEIFQLGTQTRAAALTNWSKNLEKVLSSSKSEEGRISSSIRGFVERTNLKPSVTLIMEKTGMKVPYQNGDTLIPLAYVFIPRFIMPDKADAQVVGQTFNQQFRLSEDPRTYVSPSFLGELYWNFGWSGLIVGMFLIGALFGVIGGGFNLAEHTNVARLLVVMTTIYLLCFRFEGNIALQYTLWIRSVVMIWLLHVLFRSRRRSHGIPPNSGKLEVNNNRLSIT